MPASRCGARRQTYAAVYDARNPIFGSGGPLLKVWKQKKRNDLFHDTLKDMYFAEKKILSALPKVGEVRQRPETAGRVREASYRDRNARLAQVFSAIDAKPRHRCKTARQDLRCHQSRYGTLWAEELGLSDATKLLEATLREEKATDEALSHIAETVVNQEAQAQGGGFSQPPPLQLQAPAPARSESSVAWRCYLLNSATEKQRRFTAIFAAASGMVIVEALRPTSSRTKNRAR
jgi:ferritin-like metal-binding protein YciE